MVGFEAWHGVLDSDGFWVDGERSCICMDVYMAILWKIV